MKYTTSVKSLSVSCLFIKYIALHNEFAAVVHLAEGQQQQQQLKQQQQQ